MVHIVPSGNTGQGSTFVFNIDEDVGTGRANLLEDVEFVRLAFFALREVNFPRMAPSRAACATELEGLSPSGGFAPDLEAVIRAFERHHGGTQDGCVSPMRGSVVNDVAGMYDHRHTWIVIPLNNYLRVLLGPRFPRLDASAFCGPGLRSRMLAMFGYI